MPGLKPFKDRSTGDSSRFLYGASVTNLFLLDLVRLTLEENARAFKWVFLIRSY